MRRVLLNMKDFIFADAVAQALRGDETDGFAVQNIGDPAEIVKYCGILSPFALLMEVTRYAPYTLEARMCVAEDARRAAAGCKIVLLVDENSEKELADRVRQAKKDGLIDQFIYGSISSAYLLAIMDAL